MAAEEGRVSLTYRISQCKVITLRGEDGKQPRFAQPTVRTSHQERQDAHQRKHAHLGDQHAPQERPHHVGELELHHVPEEQRRKRERRHEAAQAPGLSHTDDLSAARHVATQDDAETLEQRRKQSVDGHGRRRQRIVGNVLAMNGDIMTSIHDGIRHNDRSSKQRLLLLLLRGKVQIHHLTLIFTTCSHSESYFIEQNPTSSVYDNYPVVKMGVRRHD